MVLAAPIYHADEGDGAMLVHSVMEAQTNLSEAGIDVEIEEVAADNGSRPVRLPRNRRRADRILINVKESPSSIAAQLRCLSKLLGPASKIGRTGAGLRDCQDFPLNCPRNRSIFNTSCNTYELSR